MFSCKLSLQVLAMLQWLQHSQSCPTIAQSWRSPFSIFSHPFLPHFLGQNVIQIGGAVSIVLQLTEGTRP